MIKIYIIIMVLFMAGVATTRQLMTKEFLRIFGPGLVIAFAIILAAGMFQSKFPIFLLACFVSFFIGIGSRVEAACRFLLLTALTPAVAYHLRIGGAALGDLQPLMMYGVALGIACLVFPRSSGSGKTGVTREDLATLAIIMILTFGPSRLFTFTVIARDIVNSGLMFLLPYLTLVAALRSRDNSRLFMGAVVGAVIILAFFALYEARFGWSLFDGIWERFQPVNYVTKMLRVRSGLMRTPTTFNESTALAVFAVTGTAAAIYMRELFATRGRWRIAVAMVSVVLTLAQSRGAFIGLGIGLVLTPLLRGQSGKAVINGSLFAIFVGVLMLAAQFSQRAASFVGMNAALAGDDYRQHLFSRGLQEGMKHPILGSDVEDVKQRMTDLGQGEHMIDFVNSYLTIFLISGLVGLITFTVLAGMTLAKLGQNGRPVRVASRQEAALTDAVLCAFIATLTALVFTSLYERNPLWLLMLFAIAKLAGRRTADRTTKPVSAALTTNAALA